MNKNKYSMEKREQIIDLLNKCIIGESVANTADRILDLFAVSGRSEQLKAFAKHYNKQHYEEISEEFIDEYVKSL